VEQNQLRIQVLDGSWQDNSLEWNTKANEQTGDRGPQTAEVGTNGITYGDPNVLGSRWTLAMAYVNASDGAQRTLALAQPFYSLDAPWTATVKAIQFNRSVSRYNLGDIVDQFKRDERYHEVCGGLSSGLVEGWTRRVYGGMQYDQNRLAQIPGTSTPAAILPPNRTLSYPFIAAEMVQDDFRKVGDQNQIGRTEDLYFGTRLYMETGYSATAFGASQIDLLFTTSAAKGYQLSELTQLFLAGTVNTRLESGSIRNLFADATATYYWRWQPDDLLFVFFSGTTTHALDPDSQLLIGGDTGLRGYPLRYESGTSRSLLTIESCGIRFGNTRSGLGNVLHIDLAFPLNGDRSISKVQFLVQTKASY
jgi:hypothetical protein